MRRIILSVAVFLLSFMNAFSEEKILNYHSDIVINRDSTIVITENITVNAEGRSIQRGIYRDFPTKYKSKLGKRYNVDFKILDIQRDGESEPWFTKKLKNGIRIYIGDKSQYVSNGKHEYSITYMTKYQLGFFDEFDEIYWNVTGNGWGFKIDKASAEVKFNDDIGKISSYIISHEGYTGGQGSKAQDYISEVNENGNVYFETTKSLHARQGLTIVAAFEKGVIMPPSTSEMMMKTLFENTNFFVALLLMVLLLIYYYLIWLKVGVDPKKGTIIPEYYPPENLSPAETGYIFNMGHDDRFYTATIINIAVKGALSIREEKKKYWISKKSENLDKLSEFEKKFYVKLFSGKDEVRVEQKNYRQFLAAKSKLTERLEQNYTKPYFKNNTGWAVLGILFSIIIALLFGFLAPGGEQREVTLFMTVWLSFWSLGVIMLLKQVIKKFQTGAIKSAIGMSLFALPFVGGELFGLGMLVYSTSFAAVIIFAGLIIINTIFGHLLKAPTKEGRKVMDKIEGFKMYLSVAEKDRLNSIDEPDMTVELFEKYLPYALALGVDNKWSEKFDSVMSGIQEQSYDPSWYRGSRMGAIGAVGVVSSMSSSFSNSMASAATSPSSSSSGSSGGGSSGGGGGGGGGGGW